MYRFKTLFNYLLLLFAFINKVKLDTAMQRRQKFAASDFKFNLLGKPNIVGAGGNSKTAFVSDFPALEGNGISSVLFHIEPCGINLHNFHPRATELLYVIQGKLQTGFLEENGGRFISNNLNQGETTIFPQGLIHYVQNMGCKNATFISAFNNEDPGVLTVLNRLFDIPLEALQSSFQISDQTLLQNIKNKLPPNPAAGVGECKARCGLK